MSMERDMDNPNRSGTHGRAREINIIRNLRIDNRTMAQREFARFVAGLGSLPGRSEQAIYGRIRVIDARAARYGSIGIAAAVNG